MKEVYKADQKLGLFDDVKVIADLGNGVGYSTRDLSVYYPFAKVIGTNYPGSLQYLFSETFGEGYEMSKRIPPCDLVFASEYFEHFERPIDHLSEVISETKARYLVLANSFGTYSQGHFLEYKFRLQKIDQKKISRIFNDFLRQNGYRKIDAGTWNNKPTVWAR